MVAALAPDTVRGLLIEDAPFFSTEPSRALSTFSWLGFKDMYDFLKAVKKNYTAYFFRTYLFKKLLVRKILIKLSKNQL